MKVTKVDLKQTTQDGFLGGRVNLLQPKNGFRSSMDAVFLAAAIPAQKTQKNIGTRMWCWCCLNVFRGTHK